MVDGGNAVASSLLKSASCAALVIRSPSSTRTTWKDFPVLGTKWHWRTTWSMDSTLHCWLGIWCNSPRMASQNARAIEVLPVPLGPTNNHADGYGASANLLRILL